MLQSFHSSKASSTQLSRFALQRHKPAHNSSLSIDAPFTLLSTLRLRARTQLLPSGEAGKCTLLGLILRPEVELQLDTVSACAPVGRAPFGELGPRLSRLKSQSVSQQMMTAACKTMVEHAKGAKSPFSCPKQRLGRVAKPSPRWLGCFASNQAAAW